MTSDRKDLSPGQWVIRVLLISSARAGMFVSPAFLLAAWARAFTRHSVKKGRRKLEERSAITRMIAGTAAPFSRLELDIGERRVAVEVVPWLAWFRSSVYARVLTKSDLVDLSRRFSCKVRLRLVVPAGPPLPLAPYPGVLSDASVEVLEWLIATYL